jgi:hypothetical protein
MSYMSVGRSFSNNDYNVLQRVSSVEIPPHWQFRSRQQHLRQQLQHQLHAYDESAFSTQDSMTLWPTLDHPRHRKNFAGTRQPETAGLAETLAIDDLLFDGIADYVCGQYGAEDDVIGDTAASDGSAGPQHSMVARPLAASTVSSVHIDEMSHSWQLVLNMLR